jgi:hypothetical protein
VLSAIYWNQKDLLKFKLTKCSDGRNFQAITCDLKSSG